MELLHTITLGHDAWIAGQFVVEGEFSGSHDMLGVPFVVGHQGVEQVVEIPVTDDEKELLIQSAQSIQHKLGGGILDAMLDDLDSTNWSELAHAYIVNPALFRKGSEGFGFSGTDLAMCAKAVLLDYEADVSGRVIPVLCEKLKQVELIAVSQNLMVRSILDKSTIVESYLVPAQETRVEITVVNSRFIATAAPVFTVDEAKAFVARIKAEFADASHNVPVYLVGHGASVTAHCSDDGEPSGTAGRPALAVLQGSGLGDVAVVVTRYFGGTKLGTGGLVRAYGDAVREVLSILPRAVKVPTHVVQVVTPYGGFERLRRLIIAHGGEVLHEDFEAEVTVRARFAVDHFSTFEVALQEAFHGTLAAEIVVRDEIAVVP